MRVLRTSAWLLLAGCATTGASPSTDPAAAPPAEFAGTWRFTHGEPVPGDAEHPAAAINAQLVGNTVEFLPERVRGPVYVGCDNAVYETVQSPPQGLFQGFYQDAAEAGERATAFGLSPAVSPTLRIACDTGSFDFHRSTSMQPPTLVIMLDRVVYTLQRE